MALFPPMLSVVENGTIPRAKYSSWNVASGEGNVKSKQFWIKRSLVSAEGENSMTRD